jgi:zeaxanthin glucosyltransferase
VACPFELEFPFAAPPHWFYVDALVDAGRVDEPFSWELVPPDRDLVYVAMGTQTWLIEDRDRLFATFLETAARMPDLHFVLAAGEASHALGAPPPNMTVLDRAPQLALLSRASVMVTHGGLNTVKECVSMGVPMVVLPVDREQPGNAARVRYHELGLFEDYRTLTATRLGAAVDQVRKSPVHRAAIRRMQKAFEASRERNDVVRVVASCLPRSVRVASVPPESEIST